MTRLPNHWSTYSLPENATAHTVPSVATNVPHMLNPRPPLPPAATTSVSALLRSSQLGRSEQSASAGSATVDKSMPVERQTNNLVTDMAVSIEVMRQHVRNRPGIPTHF